MFVKCVQRISGNVNPKATAMEVNKKNSCLWSQNCNIEKDDQLDSDSLPNIWRYLSSINWLIQIKNNIFVEIYDLIDLLQKLQLFICIRTNALLPFIFRFFICSNKNSINVYTFTLLI